MSLRLQFFHFFKKNIYRKISLTSINYFNSSTNETSEQKKLEDYFFDPKVQKLLLKITNMDYDKVFQPKQQSIKSYSYQFVTDEELKQLQENAKKKAIQKLQMPPVMNIREPIDEVLSKDPEIQGYLDSKIVFTDISPNVNSRNRFIVVREMDGTLRKATWDERFRMNQIFFPLTGRTLTKPKLFEEPHLSRLLDEESYIFILDLACLQFEPDDPEYHKITQNTYDHISQRKKFDMLRSTRHFGPMAFYFACENKIEPLLREMIEKAKISDAVDLIRLLHILNPEHGKIEDKQDIEIIQDFIVNSSSPEKPNLELAIQTYLEIQRKNAKEKVAL